MSISFPRNTLKKIDYESKTSFCALHLWLLKVPEEMSMDTQFSVDLPDCYPNMNLLASLAKQRSLPRPLAEEQLTHQCLNPERPRLQEMFGWTGSFPGTCPKRTGKRVIFLATELSHTHRRDNKNVSEEALEDLFCPLENVSYVVAPRADLCKLS